MEMKPTNGLLMDQLNLTNNGRTKNQPIWLTIDGLKPTNDWWQTLHESFSQYHHGYTDKSCATDQAYNTNDWQTLFTWLWRWLPLRLSKRQSPTAVLFRTTLTRTITQYELLMLLGSNHLLYCLKLLLHLKFVPELQCWLSVDGQTGSRYSCICFSGSEQAVSSNCKLYFLRL